MQERLTRVQPSLLVNKHVDGVPYMSVVNDLSLSGIALKTPIEPTHAPGAKVFIEIVLADSVKPMWLPAQLVRRGLHGLVVYAFEEMRLPVRRSLQRFVESHQPFGQMSPVTLDG
jgi:hypothetical protein